MAKDGGPRVGWYRDPSGRHELRRWDGDGWSEWVIDGGRRHFDDLDGCGGPPRTELVPIDGTAGRIRRPRRRGGSSGARSSTGGARAVPSSAPVLVAGRDTARGLTIGLVTAVVAASVAWAVVSLVPLASLAGAAPGGRSLSFRYALAALAFEAVVAVGLVVAARGHAPSPLRPPTRFASEDLLRGGIAFLIALFAASFVAQTALTTSWTSLVVRADALLPLHAVLVVLVAPVLEERLFRGLLLGGLRDRFGPVVGVLGAAVINGAAMTWMGLAGGSTGVAFAAAAAGGVYGWFAHTNEDLKAPMLGHAFLALWLLVGSFQVTPRRLRASAYSLISMRWLRAMRRASSTTKPSFARRAAASAMWIPPSWWAVINVIHRAAASSPRRSPSWRNWSAVAIPGMRPTATAMPIHPMALPSVDSLASSQLRSVDSIRPIS
jgi:membrane protease YdiL (CAAX protease family)